MKTFSMLLCSMGCLSLFFTPVILYGAGEMTITNDKDKTVYTIGPDETGRKEEARDKERAWDMLKNMSIHTGKDQNNQPQGQSSGSASQSSPSSQTGK